MSQFTNEVTETLGHTASKDCICEVEIHLKTAINLAIKTQIFYYDRIRLRYLMYKRQNHENHL